MLIRKALRGFKSWNQYQAERLGVTEAQLSTYRESCNKSPYEFWKKETANSNKLKFILDHCNAEEQKFYLKDFATEELGRFLVKEVGSLSEKDMTKILDMPIRGHRLPIISTLYTIKRKAGIVSIMTNKNLTEDQVSVRGIKYVLEEKLKELHWRKMDEEIVSSQVKL